MDRQKITSTILIILEAGLLCAVIVFSIFANASSGVKQQGGKQSEQTESYDDSQSTEDLTTENTESSQSTGSEGGWFATEEREVFSDAVEQKLASMTTEQKVAQLFIISPESLTGVDRVTISGNGTRDALNQYPVGGLIYAQKNFMGTAQATSLIEGAQEHAQNSIGVPLFILIDEDAPDYVSFATLSLTPQDKGAIAMEVSDAPAMTDGIQTCTYTNTLEIVAAIKGGMDMIYTPDGFTEAYEAVLEAVNDGTISKVRLENAVGRVLTEKME